MQVVPWKSMAVVPSVQIFTHAEAILDGVVDALNNFGGEFSADGLLGTALHVARRGTFRVVR